MSVKAPVGIGGHCGVLQEPEPCGGVTAVVETVHAEIDGSVAVGQLVGGSVGVGDVILGLHRGVDSLLPGPLAEIVDVLAATAAEDIVSMSGRIADQAGRGQRVTTVK